jgi:hypothetical protein
MRGLTAQDILAVWEAGQDQHPVDRTLTMLEPAFPDSDRAALAALPIGRRDSLLFRLREALLGPKLRGLAECPKCHCRVEFDFSIETLSSDKHTEREFALRLGRRKEEVRFRLPDSFDLAAAAICADVATARATIARRCLLDEKAGRVLGEKGIEQVAAAMEKADPHAEVLLEMRCPGCTNKWQVELDIASFFWQELAALARDLLGDVAVLARAYGWSEQDILAMNPARRRLYLEELV